MRLGGALLAGSSLLSAEVGKGAENSLEAHLASGWSWSGEVGSTYVYASGLALSGGVEGNFLRAERMPEAPSEWLFLKLSWLHQNAAEEPLVVYWNGCEISIHATVDGWVPSMGDLFFKPDFAAPFGSSLEVGMRVDEAGRVDFSWNGNSLIEGGDFAHPVDPVLLVTVPPGYVLGLETLSWETSVPWTTPAAGGPAIADTVSKSTVGDAGDGLIAAPRERALGEPPLGLPPPHPTIAMDEDRRLLGVPGRAVEGSDGSLHAGRALVGSGRAKVRPVESTTSKE